MAFYEYKVIPAPDRPPKLRKLKGAERFAAGLEQVMNEQAAEGWEFHRLESLPDEERRGFSPKTVVTRHLMVFRRELFFEQYETRALPRASEEHDPAAKARAPLVAKRQG